MVVDNALLTQGLTLFRIIDGVSKIFWHILFKSGYAYLGLNAIWQNLLQKKSQVIHLNDIAKRLTRTT